MSEELREIVQRAIDWTEGKHLEHGWRDWGGPPPLSAWTGFPRLVELATTLMPPSDGASA